jgi:phytol kinase
MAVILSVLLIFCLLVVSEIWWRHKPLHDEFTRKFVHISVGSFVAFWPYFLSETQILILSGAFILAITLSKILNIFGAIHSVQRPTLGEIWFALMVGLLAILPISNHVFTVALLEMSLADGLAAVIGSRFGKSTAYTILGATKSRTGSITFFITSCLILIGFTWLNPGFNGLWIVPISVLATVLENVGVYGLDNLFVPLTVAAVLNLLS